MASVDYSATDESFPKGPSDAYSPTSRTWLELRAGVGFIIAAGAIIGLLFA